MGFVTRFTPHAQRDMLKLPRPEALRILRRRAELQKALDAGGLGAFDIKALQGRSGRWRRRVGDHRVVYTIGGGELIVWVPAAGDRREIHRDLWGAGRAPADSPESEVLPQRSTRRLAQVQLSMRGPIGDF